MKSASQLFNLLKQAGRSLLSRDPAPAPTPPRQAQTDVRPPYTGRRSAARVSTQPSQFLHCSFECPAGSRDYRLFVPSCYAGRPLPLIIMLHGCKQNPEDFAAGTGMNEAAEATGLLVAYPAQTKAANRMHCWNWFQEKHQKRGEGEPAIIAGITRDIMKRYAVDARQVYVAGLSAGGSMAVVMGNTYPDLYAAIGVHSGLAYRGADNAYSAIFAMQRGARIKPPPAGQVSAPAAPTMPAIVFHGENDRTVHPDNGKLVIAHSAPNSLQGRPPAEVEISVRRGQVDGGHAYTQTAYLDRERMTVAEHWLVHGSGHAWSGGRVRGSYTDGKGPDATREMLRFLLSHRHTSRVQ
ncbi:MAG: PHB depolymerase family esterase [Noviherbaspirillum sp.]